ncbi:hypothetical protein BDQ17DRAFT_1434366 [Cyathus striatus]|nr:hypothetical protein BDQ17DRAFT_1434366 [Cyathus striatus]
MEEAMNQHEWDAFYSIRYCPVAGLQGLHDTMMDYAQSMPTPLDDYSFTQAFINAMPEEMRRKLIEDMLLTPEVNMADDFLAVGHTVERGKCNYINMECYLNNHIRPLVTRPWWNNNHGPGDPHQMDPTEKTRHFKKDCPRALHDQVHATHSMAGNDPAGDGRGKTTPPDDSKTPTQETPSEDDVASTVEFDVEENPYSEYDMGSDYERNYPDLIRAATIVAK